MSKLQKVLSVAAAAALALSMTILPAQAAATPATWFCTGTATVYPGLYHPVIGPSQDFTWELETTCTTVSQDAIETFILDVSVSGNGWCSRSIGFDGSGTLENPDTGQVINLSNIGWEGAGSTLLATGNHDGGGIGQMLAQVYFQGDQPCWDGGGSGSMFFPVILIGEFL